MDADLKRKFINEDDDIPEEDQIFSSRIKKFPIITPEEIEKMMKQNDEQQKEEIKEIEVEIEEFKPTRGRGRRGRGRGRKSKIKTKVMIKKTSEESLLRAAEENLNLSRSTKRRLQRLQETEANKIKEMEEENARLLAFNIFDDDVNIEIVDVTKTPEKNTELFLKVQYLGNIKKLKCDQTEKFSSIFVKVGDAFDLKASEVLLCHKNRNIQVDDTPSSLDIKFYDLIECLPYKAENNETELDDNQIKVKMQSNDSKKKIDMAIHRLESMQDVMVRYANLREIPLTRMVFEFDGEKIEGTETPEDLEMESGSCIDVKITAEKQQKDEVMERKKDKEIAIFDIDDSSNSNS